MADHFVGFSRGVEGTKYSDFTTGTASTAGLDFELRIKDNTSPNIPTKVDVLKALEALERFFQNAQQASAAGFVING